MEVTHDPWWARSTESPPGSQASTSSWCPRLAQALGGAVGSLLLRALTPFRRAPTHSLANHFSRSPPTHSIAFGVRISACDFRGRGGGGEGRHKHSDPTGSLSSAIELLMLLPWARCFLAAPPGAGPWHRTSACRRAVVGETGVAVASSSNTTASHVKGSPQNLKPRKQSVRAGFQWCRCEHRPPWVTPLINVAVDLRVSMNPEEMAACPRLRCYETVEDY